MNNLEGKQDFLEDKTSEQIELVKGLIETLQKTMAVMFDDKQNQLNQIKAELLGIKRNMAFLGDTKQDAKGGGGF